MQRKTWIIAGVAVLAFGGILSLFEDDGDTDTTENAKPSATASVTPDAKSSSTTPKPSSAVPSPDAAQTAALIRALTAIDPGLTAKEDRAVDRSRNVCSDVKGGKDAVTVQNNAKARFEGGTVPSLTDDQTVNIVTAVKSSFCD
ncbi:hypothetical protein ACIPN8_31420 [Streptomyces sp. NPDC086082]|uniref:hypothetical protein n=1 Tax=Streptomyces sp. NPDC086082 TaxID=3365750 RepID=UPI003827092D